MKSIQRFLIAIVLLTGFAGATFAQHGPDDKGGGPSNGGPGKHGRGNPDQLNLSDSCWRVFLSQLPADSAAMLVRAMDCLKSNRADFEAAWAELRAAHQAKDTAKIAALRARMAQLRAQREDCGKIVKMILRQYRGLLSRIHKECDNPRRDSIGHKGPRDSSDHKGPGISDVKVGMITPNPVPTGQASAELTYGIREDAKVVITINDQLGNLLKEVFNGDVTAGPHTQTLDLTGMPAGMYYVRVQAGSGVGTARLVIQ